MKDNVKKYIFLEVLDDIYKDKSINYLYCLKDAITIIIQQREKGCYKPYREHFKGVIYIG